MIEAFEFGLPLTADGDVARTQAAIAAMRAASVVPGGLVDGGFDRRGGAFDAQVAMADQPDAMDSARRDVRPVSDGVMPAWTRPGEAAGGVSAWPAPARREVADPHVVPGRDAPQGASAVAVPAPVAGADLHEVPRVASEGSRDEGVAAGDASSARGVMPADLAAPGRPEAARIGGAEIGRSGFAADRAVAASNAARQIMTSDGFAIPAALMMAALPALTGGDDNAARDDTGASGAAGAQAAFARDYGTSAASAQGRDPQWMAPAVPEQQGGAATAVLPAVMPALGRDAALAQVGTPILAGWNGAGEGRRGIVPPGDGGVPRGAAVTPAGGADDSGPAGRLDQAGQTPIVVHTEVHLDGAVVARSVTERIVAGMNGPLAGTGGFDPRRSYTPVEG